MTLDAEFSAASTIEKVAFSLVSSNDFIDEPELNYRVSNVCKYTHLGEAVEWVPVGYKCSCRRCMQYRGRRLRVWISGMYEIGCYTALHYT